MTDTLHERCLRAAEEALPCSHTSHTCEKGNHFMPCHGALRYAVATAMEKLVREERDRALQEAAEDVKGTAGHSGFKVCIMIWSDVLLTVKTRCYC